MIHAIITDSEPLRENGPPKPDTSSSMGTNETFETQLQQILQEADALDKEEDTRSFATSSSSTRITLPETPWTVDSQTSTWSASPHIQVPHLHLNASWSTTWGSSGI